MPFYLKVKARPGNPYLTLKEARIEAKKLHQQHHGKSHVLILELVEIIESVNEKGTKKEGGNGSFS